ncbi:MAG: hypothetical protein Q8R25_01530 [bacterium]|nr:hypothetical protein [bacterium]
MDPNPPVPPHSHNPLDLSERSQNTNHENERIDRLRRAMYSRSLSGKIKDRERRGMEPTQQIVGEDFKHFEPGVEGTVVAPHGIALTRTLLWWLLGGSIVFFVGTLLFFGYYFFFGPASISASPGNINIAIAGPPQVAGGQASELQIIVTNRNNVPLQSADLVVNFPKGTRSPTDFVTDEPVLRQSLGTIEPGGQRQGTIKAVFSGKEGDVATLKVEVEYRLQGSGSIYVASSDYTLSFSSSPLTVSVDGNTQTISDQPVQLTVAVQSNASAPIKDALLKADYPFGFKFTSASPAPKMGGFWELGDLAPGAKRTIIINGTLSGEAADERIFNFTAGTRKSTAVSQIDTPFSDTPFHMTISQPFLGLTISVNKAISQNVIVAPGDNVTVGINWQNNLSTAVTDAVIVAKLSGLPIDGASVHTTDGFYRSSDGTLIWDKTTTNGELTNLTPGARGVVGFTFQMPANVDTSQLRSPYLDITVNAAGNRVSESGVPQNLQSTSRQKIALASDLQFVAQGLYYQSPFGSVGPMPPKAGTETTYAIVFTVNNTTNKVTGATVTAVLPPSVRYTGHSSPQLEDVTFNQSNNMMTWNLNTIDPGVGLNEVPPRQMAVEIGFTPSTSQIGQEPSLIQKITLSGTDDATKATITRRVSDVTTNLAQASRSSADIVVGTDKGFNPSNAAVVK